MRQVFDYQEELWRGGKLKFGDQNSKLRDLLIKPLAKLCVEGAKRGGAKVELAGDIASIARERAEYVARLVNEKTTEMIRADKDPFTDNRAADIGVTEATWAENVAFGMAKKGKKVQWNTEAGACKECQKLNGMVKKVGEAFTKDYNGDPVYNPPLHPNCKCKLGDPK